MKKIIKSITRLFESKISPKYQRYNLIKIEKQNKRLSPLEIIKLKRKYLDSVEEKIDYELKLIKQILNT